MKKEKKKLEVKIKWEYLQRIAEYYKFPSAVFLCNMKMLPKSTETRDEGLRKKAELYDRIKEIIEEG